MKKGQTTQKKLEIHLKNKDNTKSGFKIVFWGVGRDKVGQVGFFWVDWRDVGFRFSSRDCPDEIRTVGKCDVVRVCFDDRSKFACGLPLCIANTCELDNWDVHATVLHGDGVEFGAYLPPPRRNVCM